ncbi:hypothetical protein DFJ74DRAFT_672504 [Hyaloraphidium curvatum]|nr:hypothetical protein DFJ74DRAFT_672504 [Hyaloraphidium curvatum]
MPFFPSNGVCRERVWGRRFGARAFHGAPLLSREPAMASAEAPSAGAPASGMLITDIALGIARFLEPPGMRGRADTAGLAGPPPDAAPLGEQSRAAWRALDPHRHPHARSADGGVGEAGKRARRDLLSLAKVCRALADAALPSLYYELALDGISPRRLELLARTLAGRARDGPGPHPASLVRVVRVRSWSPSSAHVVAILRATGPHLFALDMARCKLRGWLLHRGPPALDAFPAGSRLRALNLSMAGWDHSDKGGSKLAKMLAEKFPHLEVLGLEQAGHMPAQALVKLVVALPRLRELRFGSHHMMFSAKWVSCTASASPCID